MSVDQPRGANIAAATVPLDIVEARMADGATIFVRRMSRSGSVRLILSHGNGLAIDGFEEFWKRLVPFAEVVVLDFRNHGANPPAPQSPLNNWQVFVSDLEEVLDVIDRTFGTKPTFGAFHSMSALTSLLHASKRPHPWRGLVLFEPPAVPPPGRPERDETLEMHRVLALRTRKRRVVYDNPDQLAGSFARILMFQRMPDGARRQLARATLRPEADGTYRLACPPDFEADTFAIDKIEPHWERFAAVSCPVTIVSSAPEDSDMPVVSRISRMLAADCGFQYVELPACGHLVMLDHAERCAAVVLAKIRQLPSQ